MNDNILVFGNSDDVFTLHVDEISDRIIDRILSDGYPIDNDVIYSIRVMVMMMIIHVEREVYNIMIN